MSFSLKAKVWLICGVLFILAVAGIIGANRWNATHPFEAARAVSPFVYDALLVLGLAAITTAIFAHVALGRSVFRFATITLLPVAWVVMGLTFFFEQPGPSEINRVTLRDGRVIILAMEPVLSDSIYRLWKPDPPFGFTWSRLPMWLNYSEDGAFTDEPRLLLSREGRYLVVARGGILTDCLMTDAELALCSDSINIVKMFDPLKRKTANNKNDYVATQPYTHFTGIPVKHRYPDGLIMPLVYGLKGIMKVTDGRVVWAEDPAKFLDRNLKTLAAAYKLVLDMARFDPQKLAKNPASHEFAVSEFEKAFFKEQTLELMG